MRSTFKILFYINRSKTKTDGKTAILCHITIDGRSVVITTNEECSPAEWNTGLMETTEKKTNLRLCSFRERVEQGYSTLLYQYGAVSAELLKNHLRGVGANPTTLLAMSRNELERQREAIGKSKSPNTYKNNSYSDKELARFVRSKGEDDIALTVLTESFFDDYRIHLKKKGFANSSVNKHLCWLSRLMYRAISQSTIRSNPFEGAKYEKVVYTPRFLNKNEVAKLMAFTSTDETAELSRRMFLFSVFTGLSFADLQGLRISQIETDREGRRYIRKARQKTEVESLVPLHPIAEQILDLYVQKGIGNNDSTVFSEKASQAKLLLALKAVGLACGVRESLSWHCARHSFGTLTLEAGVSMESIAKMMGHSSIASTQIYAQITDRKISKDMDTLIRKRR